MTVKELAARLGISEKGVLKRASVRGIKPARYERNEGAPGVHAVYSLEQVEVICRPLQWVQAQGEKPARPLSFEEFMRKVEAA